MPLRDHFRPPLDDVASWEEFHGQWPAVLVQQLRKQLPAGYVAAPHVRAGSRVEIDVAAYEKGHSPPGFGPADDDGATTAVWAPPAPNVAVETELPDYDEYEVRVYDARRNRQLVAAIEIVSPANKDRSEKRNAFVGKCAALLRKGVAVSIVDLVTVRHFNLYVELLADLDQADPLLGTKPSPIYAASCRWVRKGERAVLETWAHALTIGQHLPTLPLWLTDVLVVPLDLEQSYEKACDDLGIR